MWYLFSSLNEGLLHILKLLPIAGYRQWTGRFVLYLLPSWPFPMMFLRTCVRSLRSIFFPCVLYFYFNGEGLHIAKARQHRAPPHHLTHPPPPQSPSAINMFSLSICTEWKEKGSVGIVTVQSGLVKAWPYFILYNQKQYRWRRCG